MGKGGKKPLFGDRILIPHAHQRVSSLPSRQMRILRLLMIYIRPDAVEARQLWHVVSTVRATRHEIQSIRPNCSGASKHCLQP